MKKPAENLEAVDKRLALILNNVTDIVFLLVLEGGGIYRFLYVNAPFLTVTGLTEDQVIGNLVTDVVPKPAHDLILGKYQEAIHERHVVEWQETSLYPSGERIGNVRVIPIFDGLNSVSHLLGTVQDITDQKHWEAEILLTQASLRDAKQRTANILESITDAFFALDNEWRFTYLNDQAQILLKRERQEIFGKSVWDSFPEAVGSEFDHQYRLAVQDQIAVTFEAFYPPLDAWFEVRAYPSPDGLSVYFHDITPRKQVEEDRERLLTEAQQRAEREALLNRIGSAIRTTTDPDEIQQVVVRTVGETLRVDRCYFSLYDLAADWRWVGDDFRRSDLPSLAGHYRISDYRVRPEDYYPNERPLVIADTTAEQWHLPNLLLMALRQLRIRAALSVPIFEGGRLIATFAIAMADAPRKWSEDEVRLAEAVAALTRSALEASRLLAEQRAHLYEEALLGRIGIAIRTELNPEVIQEKAAALLGEALGVDRCFYINYDSYRDAATVGSDYHSPHLTSIGGDYPLSEFRETLSEIFTNSETLIIPDVTTMLSPNAAGALSSFQIRGVLAVPLFDGSALVAALWATNALPRAWTKHETTLIEQAATLTRTAIESARSSRKERTIAKQLQDALQPSLPDSIPGLLIGSYTQPALDEASIGGDFMDVFALDNEHYAIVIGDVSGKGLAAAQQLALIRNTLRTLLYLYSSPTKAASVLNGIVTAHDLLVGFVTAFIGVYDAGIAQITYCSCGHEPAMLRRTEGVVELIENTGPPIGMSENAYYGEANFKMHQGDHLLLYTDGLSEAGPSRIQLLGTTGLVPLLSQLPPNANVQSNAELIVANVNAYANGTFRDDVAVLLLKSEVAC